MAAKKKVSNKKPKTQSGQGYADNYKKKRELAFSRMYADATSTKAENPGYYAGPKGMKKFAEAVKDKHSHSAFEFQERVRRSSGDMGAARAASRARTVRKGGKKKGKK